jgi:hypothetical protein
MELAWDDFKELIIKQQSFVYQLLVPQHKIQGSLTLSNTIIYHFGIIYKCNASTRNLTWHYCWGIPAPHVRTGGVLIVAHRRLSTLTQYFTWFDKLPTSTGEVHFIRDREMIQ